MKKLLLTLFAVAAIVACQKDDTSVDVATPELSNVEIAGVEDSYTIDDALELLNSVGKNVEMEPSTSKVGAAGSNFLHIVLFDHNSAPLAALSSEDGTELCFDGLTGFQMSILYTLDEANSQLIVEMEAPDGTITNADPTNLSATLLARFQGASFFGGSLDQLIVNTNSDRTAAAAGSVPSGGLFNFGCGIDATQYYEVVPAPFPLSGFLARITDSSFDGSSLNYAASSREAVEAAIAADIMDGN